MKSDTWVLHTWASIAEYMNMSVSTLQRKYAASKKTKDPMPLIFDGRVSAVKTELQVWMKRKNRVENTTL